MIGAARAVTMESTAIRRGGSFRQGASIRIGGAPARVKIPDPASCQLIGNGMACR
jgi:hypothetical protein